MKGTPVYRGVVRGTARVALDLEEAKEIKCGDILITRSTDIGWSPYFPLLAGVVTELGGLISHGMMIILSIYLIISQLILVKQELL